MSSVSSPAPDLAVVIPHYNDVTRLLRCLEALAPQRRPGLEVVVADNASREDLAAVTARFAWARIVTEPEAGAGLARNRGVAETSAPWIAFLDADCVPAPDWVAKLGEIIAGDPAQITGGRVDVFDETPAPRSGAEAFETVFAFDQAGYIAHKGFSVTANLVSTRATVERTGPFAVGVSEDLDWCQRATAAGATLVYAQDLAVSHPTRSDWAALRRKWLRLTNESFGLIPAGPVARLRWAARALAMPVSVIAHVPRILHHDALSGRERMRGIATLGRLRLTRMVWMLRQAWSGRPIG